MGRSTGPRWRRTIGDAPLRRKPRFPGAGPDPTDARPYTPRMSANDTVTAGKVVTIHYHLTLDDGQVVDSSRDDGVWVAAWC